MAPKKLPQAKAPAPAAGKRKVTAAALAAAAAPPFGARRGRERRLGGAERKVERDGAAGRTRVAVRMLSWLRSGSARAAW